MKGFIRTVFFLIVVYNVLRALIAWWINERPQEQMVWFAPSCEEQMIENENSLDRWHQREWTGPGLSNSFCMQYESSQTISQAQSEMRNNMSLFDRRQNFWGSLYEQLVLQSDTSLNYIADSLLVVSHDHQLGATDLAKLTVSFIQDIPYSYVMPVDCSNYNVGNTPCLGHQQYGIVSPYEFAHTLYGDCDTRAVLLYVLLKKMGFDPMIVVSDEYAHAMLAVNLPAQGDYIEHAGKRYYFWETTAKGWGIGMLPPDTNNKNYWQIALVHES